MEQTPWRWGEPGAIGRILAAARQRAGLTQAELARRLAVSAANLSRIEHGSDLRVSTLLEIARELQFEPMLIPKNLAPAVRAILEEQKGGAERPERGRFA
jgi:transcriptional regulator with XRE-family HTH domain